MIVCVPSMFYPHENWPNIRTQRARTLDRLGAGIVLVTLKVFNVSCLWQTLTATCLLEETFGIKIGWKIVSPWNTRSKEKEIELHMLSINIIIVYLGRWQLYATHADYQDVSQFIPPSVSQSNIKPYCPHIRISGPTSEKTTKRTLQYHMNKGTHFFNKNAQVI